MKEANEAILFYELLSPEEQQAFRTLLASDPTLREAIRHWRQVRGELRRCLDELVPDRGLLVSYALYTSGRAGLLSEPERQALEAARPGIERALRQHPGLADAVRRIQADATCFEEVWDEHCGESAERIKPFRRDRDAIAPDTRMRKRTHLVWRIVAGVAVVAFLAVSLLIVQRDSEFETIRTASGEMRLLEMADGSKVRLMGESELSYADSDGASGAARRVKLKGRAYFEVVPDRRPFTVETPEAVATVLGTSFGVSADDHATEVVLATGRVAVAPRTAPEHMVTLDPGEKTRVDEGAQPTAPSPVVLNEELSWTGLFIFTASPLEEIAAILARHYDTPVAVAGELRAEAVTGTFEQKQSLDEIVDALAATLGASVEGDAGQGYHIVPRP